MGREEAKSPLFGLQSDPSTFPLEPKGRLDSRGVVVMHFTYH